MKSMMVLIRSAAEMLETAKRELPRKNPEKNKIKKRSTDDSEPPASGSPGAASPRIVFAPRARGSGIPGSRRHRLFGQRRGPPPRPGRGRKSGPPQKAAPTRERKTMSIWAILQFLPQRPGATRKKTGGNFRANFEC